MEFKDLLKGSIGRLDTFLEYIKEKYPYKISVYASNISPFEFLRTEKAVEVVKKVEELTEVVRELKDDKKELLSKLDLTNKLLADLVKNSKAPVKKINKIEKKK